VTDAKAVVTDTKAVVTDTKEDADWLVNETGEARVFLNSPPCLLCGIGVAGEGRRKSQDRYRSPP
jgi:hypothetical protein